MLIRRYQIPLPVCQDSVVDSVLTLGGGEDENQKKKTNAVFVLCWKWLGPHGAPEGISRTYKGHCNILRISHYLGV